MANARGGGSSCAQRVYPLLAPWGNQRGRAGPGHGGWLRWRARPVDRKQCHCHQRARARAQESAAMPPDRFRGLGFQLPLNECPLSGKFRGYSDFRCGPLAVRVAFPPQPLGGSRGLLERRRAGRASGCLLHRRGESRSTSSSTSNFRRWVHRGGGGGGGNRWRRASACDPAPPTSTAYSQAGLLEKMQEKLVKVDSLESRIAQLEVPEASARTPARMFSTAVEGAPAWAPQLFGEGAQAKLDPEQVKQLLVLAGRGPKNLGDVGSASSAIQPKTNASILGASAKARPAPMTLLGAAPEGGKEDEDVPGACADDGEASALARILVQQTQILNQLASSSKKSSDPLQSLLGGGGGGDDEAKIAGVRGMAARQLLREQFAAHPERVVAKVRERLALARRKGSVAELEPRDMYLHFQETVPLGTFKTLTYFSFLMAEMWEAAERNQGAELMSLLALGLVFAEQVANEQGHTRLGWLLTGRPDPPFSIVEQRRAPRPELPHGMLADPRWVTAQLAYLRDADLISERTTKVHLNLTPQGGQQGQDDGTKGPGRGRGRKGKRTDQTGETTA